MKMMKNIRGEKFGKLTVLHFIKINSAGSATWRCKCDCGKEINASLKQLRKKSFISCGCVTKDKKLKAREGSIYNHPLYSTYSGMLRRCYGKRTKTYKSYGAKGVEVCKKWRLSFEEFVKDMGERPEGFTLDRINPFGNYEPENCRWADAETQAKNKRANYTLV
jgi:hypothetical protein